MNINSLKKNLFFVFSLFSFASVGFVNAVPSADQIKKNADEKTVLIYKILEVRNLLGRKVNSNGDSLLTEERAEALDKLKSFVSSTVKTNDDNFGVYLNQTYVRTKSLLEPLKTEDYEALVSTSSIGLHNTSAVEADSKIVAALITDITLGYEYKPSLLSRVWATKFGKIVLGTAGLAALAGAGYAGYNFVDSGNARALANQIQYGYNATQNGVKCLCNGAVTVVKGLVESGTNIWNYLLVPAWNHREAVVASAATGVLFCLGYKFFSTHRVERTSH